MIETEARTPSSRKHPADQVVLGNVYNKYESRNPVARRLLKGYFGAFAELSGHLSPSSVLEVGCGEGYLTRILCSWWPKARVVGIDLSADLFGVPGRSSEVPGFLAQSAYRLGFAGSSFDLVVGAEVLEHLEDPEQALEEIERVGRGEVILSVPREPVWRMLNILRLTYLREWGNTPGHLQHWSTSDFRDLVASRFEILQVRTPLPWTMILARKKGPVG